MLLDSFVKDFKDLGDNIKSRLMLLTKTFNKEIDLVDSKFFVFDNVYNFEINLDEFEDLSKAVFIVIKKNNFIIKGSNTYNLFNFVFLDSANIVLYPNAKEVNAFFLCNCEINMLINPKDNINARFNLFVEDSVNSKLNVSLFNRVSSKMVFNTSQNKNSKLTFNFMSVNLNSLIVDAWGKIRKKDPNTSLDINLRCLNLGCVELMPVLEISNNNVKASHSGLSYGFDKTELFYFMSKGINEKEARNIIVKERLGKYLKDSFFDRFLDEIKL